MNWEEVALTFEKLEKTSSRRAKIEILGGLLRETPEKDVDKLIYLMHGRLGPPYESPDFGMDEQLILRTLEEVTGRSSQQIATIYKKTGDLGLTAAQLLFTPSSHLTLAQVYDVLKKIAEATGSGAIDQKVDLLAKLLRKLSGKEAEHVLRILQGRLRLGIGDATLMDALSWAKTGTTRQREKIERAYELCADLGFVARVFLTEGTKGLEDFHPQVGKPIRVALANRLPSAAEIIAKMGKVDAEPKYDGMRTELHRDGDKIKFFTRRMDDVTGMYPELAKAAREEIKAKQAIIDGEAVGYNPETGEYLPFQLTMQRKRKYGVKEMEERYPLRLFAFDLLYVDGEDYTRKPLRERRRKLREIIKSNADSPIQVTESLITSDPKALQEFFLDMVSRGLEGIMVKRLDAPYQAGERTDDWIKLKRAYSAELRDTIDVVIVGYEVGRGKRAKFGIGSLLAAVYDPKNDRYRTVSKIGSGPSEEEWKKLKQLLDQYKVENKPAQVDSEIVPDVWVLPKYVVTVQADEITRSPRHTCGKVDDHPGYALRFPRMLDWIRSDKGPEDATTEKEILDMYKNQKENRKEAA